MIGYCLGGTIAWLSATRLNPDTVVGYYARETPKVPVMLLSASATPTSQKQRWIACKRRIPKCSSSGITPTTLSTASHGQLRANFSDAGA
jgi:dienelactone hydrolase